MQDHKSFKIVSVLQGSTFIGIASAYDAAKFMLEHWLDEDGIKARLAREILLKCLEGNCSAAVARVAFVEALREADISSKQIDRLPLASLIRSGQTKAGAPSLGQACDLPSYFNKPPAPSTSQRQERCQSGP